MLDNFFNPNTFNNSIMFLQENPEVIFAPIDKCL